MAALFAGVLNGEGQHVDISLAETHFGGVDRRHATAIAWQFSQRKTLRAAGGATGMPQGIYPCIDGYVDFTNAGGRPDRIADMLDQAEWLDDPMFQDPEARVKPDVVEAWNAFFLMWCLERTKREIWAEARRAKVMCGPLFTTQDMYEDDHFRDRGFWATTQHPAMGEVEFHGRPFIMQEGGWEIRRPAPLLGQHTGEVLREAGLPADQIARILAAGRT
jgi:crotonobetainyl-CoA:carnitine CoA-transferase CaiB-like acyl-CoA transferase